MSVFNYHPILTLSTPIFLDNEYRQHKITNGNKAHRFFLYLRFERKTEY